MVALLSGDSKGFLKRIKCFCIGILYNLRRRLAKQGNNDLASMEWCDELLSVPAHSLSQFVPGSYNGLGFLWLTPATLTG